MEKDLNVRMGKPGDEKDDKRVRKFIIAGVSLLLVIIAVLLIFLLPKRLHAIDIRIQRLVGMVTLLDEKGKDLSLTEKMKLNSGQSLATADESLVMMSLDQIKLVTLEAESKAKIKSYGRELEFELTEGDLFFNVTEKLPSDEKFDIRTSNMLCGIRGTSGFAGKDDAGHDILMVTDGEVSVKAFNPVTKEAVTTVVHSGEMITIYLDDEAEGDATVSFVCNKFREEDLPALALDAIRKDEALQKKIQAATGFNTKKIIELAKVNSKNGISMYGQAADDLAKAGIDDAIPVMGSPARDMIRTANRAADTAKDDLNLEISIIKGMRDVLDTGMSAGCQKDELSELMTNSTTCVIDTVERARKVGLDGEALSRVSASVSGTLSNSIRDMKGSNLSRQEINNVVEAIGTVYGNAIAEAKNNGLDSEGIVSALDGVSDFAKATVNSEMKQSSTGDETVIALLGNGGTDTAKAGEDEVKKEKADTDTANAGDNSDGNGQNGANGINANGTKNGGNGNSYTPPKNFTPGLLEPGIEPDVSDHITNVDPATGKLTLSDGTVFDPVYYAAANPDAFAKYGYNTNDLLYDYLNRKNSAGDGSPVYASIENKKAEEAAAYQKFAEEIAAEEQARQNSENLVASAGGSSNEGGNEGGGSSGGGGSGGGGGGGAGGVTDNGDGTYTVYGTAGNATVSVDNSGWIYFQDDNTNIVLPLDIGGHTINAVGVVDFNGHSNNTATITYGGTTTVTKHKNGNGQDVFTVNGNDYTGHSRNFNDPNDPSKLTSVDLSSSTSGGPDIRIDAETGAIS